MRAEGPRVKIGLNSLSNCFGLAENNIIENNKKTVLISEKIKQNTTKEM